MFTVQNLNLNIHSNIMVIIYTRIFQCYIYNVSFQLSNIISCSIRMLKYGVNKSLLEKQTKKTIILAPFWGLGNIITDINVYHSNPTFHELVTPRRQCCSDVEQSAPWHYNLNS